MRSPLYTDIIQALATAKALGAFEERHRGETVSSREALRRYGSRVVTEYRRQYGTPQRTGAAGNSKLRYQVALLEALRAGDEIERCVVGFEVKVRRQQTHILNNP